PDSAPSQRAVFQRDGFVVVPGLFDKQEIARISAWTDELERAAEVPGRAMKYFEPSLLRPGERVLQRIENFCPFHAGFAELCDGDKLRGLVSRLLGEPAVLFKDKINFNRRSAGDHRVRYYADKRKSFPPDIERDPNRTYTFRV